MNALIRIKLALTEDHPTIKPYKESLWAEIHDTRTLDPSISIELIRLLHLKIVGLLESLTQEQFMRTYFHPEMQKTFTLSGLLALYDWHSRHHLGHLRIINTTV